MPAAVEVSSLSPADAAYWPLWVNITVPLLSLLAYIGVQALLLFVDDPGLRSAKRAGLYPRAAPSAGAAASVQSAYVELGNMASAGRTQPARTSPEAAASATAAAAAVVLSGTDAAVQCDLLRPASSTPLLWTPYHHPHWQQHQQQQLQEEHRQRTVSFGAYLDRASLIRQRKSSETMRMLEGMLLRPSARRHVPHQHQRQPRHLSESDSRVGPAVIAEELQYPDAAAAAAPPATQSLTGPSGRRLMHSVHHYQQQYQRLQSRQMRYSTSAQSDRRALGYREDGASAGDPPVPPTPPSSDHGGD